jgi:hypothetical protein
MSYSTDSRINQEEDAGKYFIESNIDNEGRYKDECSIHALNSMLVNGIGQPPFSTWSTSGIPKSIKTLVKKKSGRIKEMTKTLWFPSLKQLKNKNQVSADWSNVFDYIDPHGHNLILNSEQFYKWSLNGKANYKFKYAIAQLPSTEGTAHAVSIIKSKHNDNLILIDSNLEDPIYLSMVALKDNMRWNFFPLSYVVIRQI